MLRQSSVRYLNEVSVGVSIPLWNREVAAAGSDAQFIGERAATFIADRVATRGRSATERGGERTTRPGMRTLVDDPVPLGGHGCVEKTQARQCG
jgi:hypothetical protein